MNRFAPEMPRASTAVSIPSRTRARLVSAVLSHGAVDFFSFMIIPLMSVLEGRLKMTHAQGAAVIAVGSVSSGLIQPGIAWLTDRWDTRWLGTLGFGVAVIAISLLGRAQTFEQLLLIQIVGAAGLGAFHPVAAAAVGQLAGARRSLGIALFYAAGMLGGMLGNVTAPEYVSFFGRGAGDASAVIEGGMRAMHWLMVPGLGFAAVLAWGIHSVAHRHHAAHDDHRQLDDGERRARWRAVGALYLGNLLRFTADLCIIQLVIRWMEATALARSGTAVLDAAVRTSAVHLNGPMQGAKQLGMGVGGIVLGFVLSRRHEKAVLLWVPIGGAVFIALMPHAAGDGWLALGLCALAGVGYAGVIPITISLAQRLLPHRTGLASGLMMGGAWTLSSVGPPIIQRVYDRFGLEWSFAGVAAMLVVAGFLALAIPGRLIAGASAR